MASKRQTSRNVPANADASAKSSNSWRLTSFVALCALFCFLTFSGFSTWLFPTWTRSYNALLLLHMGLGAISIPIFLYYLFVHLRRTASAKDKSLPIWVLADCGIVYLGLIFLEDLGSFPFNLIPIAFLGHACYCLIKFSAGQFQKKSKALLVPGFLGVFTYAGSALFGVVNTFGNIPFPQAFMNFHRYFSLAFMAVSIAHLWVFVRARQDMPPLWMACFSRRGMFALGAGVTILLLSYPAANLFIDSDSVLDGYEKTDKPIPKEFALSHARFTVDDYPSPQLMGNSKSCGDLAGCHSNILIHWESSAHRFGANRMVRTLIQRAIDEAGMPVGEFCISCHVPASLVSGSVTEDFYNQTDQAITEGSSCAVCHSFSKVENIGNSSYTIDPPFGWLQTGIPNHQRKSAGEKLIQVKPDHHNRVFRKGDPLYYSSDYCATCHEVYLPAPDGGEKLQLHNIFQSWNEWREKTGKEETCIDCHMGYFEDHVGNLIRDHRFLGGNQALDILTADWKDRIKPLDIRKFPGVRSNHHYAKGGIEYQSQLNDQFLKGEIESVKYWWEDKSDKYWWEGRKKLRKTTLEKGPNLEIVIEPDGPWKAGWQAAAKVTTRNVKAGHSYPAGSIHTLQTWLDFRIMDAAGNEIFRSGALDERHILEDGAHQLGSRYSDENGNLILDGRIWRAKKKAFYRVIPPAGQIEDEYKFFVPADAASPLKVEAAWEYRKGHQRLVNSVFGEDSGVTLPVTEVAKVSKMIDLQ